MAALVQGHGSAALDALRHPNGTTPGSRESGTAKSCQRSARRVRLHQEATGRERGRYGTDVGRTGKTNVTASFAVLTKEAVGARAVGCIRYDPAVTEAQIQERAVVELDAPAAQDVRGIGTPSWTSGETDAMHRGPSALAAQNLVYSSTCPDPDNADGWTGSRRSPTTNPEASPCRHCSRWIYPSMSSKRSAWQIWSACIRKTRLRE
jgi:hypothetical protein